ncbi:hypothetical protein BKI52_38810 [marine bacterium AO1-C]|nr:hypothetical protein BKI52_38810 [marine bacterium AO1-C]
MILYSKKHQIIGQTLVLIILMMSACAKKPKQKEMWRRFPQYKTTMEVYGLKKKPEFMYSIYYSVLEKDGKILRWKKKGKWTSAFREGGYERKAGGHHEGLGDSLLIGKTIELTGLAENIFNKDFHEIDKTIWEMKAGSSFPINNDKGYIKEYYRTINDSLYNYKWIFEYNPEGKITSLSTYQYDTLFLHKNELKRKYEWQNKDGKLYQKIEYKYDKTWNVIERIVKNEQGKTKQRNVYKYGRGNRRIEDRQYNAQGDLTDKVLYEYNSRGNITKKSVFKSGDTPEYVRTYEYDTDGWNWTERIYYENGRPFLIVDRGFVY